MYAQAATFEAAGLTTVVINAKTPDQSHMWMKVSESSPWVLLLSPKKLANDLGFQKRVCLLTVDKAYLLDTWGNSFQKAYLQIKFMCVHFEPALVMIAMTAVLLPGEQTEWVCKFIGLWDNHHTVQWSN